MPETKPTLTATKPTEPPKEKAAQAATDKAAETAEAKRKRHRNPSYPTMTLEAALDLARKVFEKEQRHEAPVATVFKHWGLSEKSSSGFTNLAALQKYGLLESVSSGDERKAKISDATYKILMDTRPNSADRKALIRAAAQKPDAIKEIVEKYGSNLPSDDNLKYWLTVEEGYSTQAADDLIKVLKANISFAELNQAGTISGDGAERIDPPDGSGRTLPPPVSPPAQPRRKMPPSASMKEVPILLDNDREALLVLPRPFSEADLADLKKSIDFLGKKLLSKGNEPDAETE